MDRAGSKKSQPFDDAFEARDIFKMHVMEISGNTVRFVRNCALKDTSEPDLHLNWEKVIVLFNLTNETQVIIMEPQKARGLTLVAYEDVAES